MIAATLVVLVAALMAWEYQRHATVSACIKTGGTWDGTACRADPGRTILQRDLQRS
ncbi:MAG: hypothetical protein ABL904_12465 [Hyphomicrobiaceae bacterium]